MVASRIARSKKAFTMAEEFILPSAIDMCREIIGEAATSKLEMVSLSNDTITQRIVEMNNDIKCRLLEKIKSSPAILSNWMNQLRLVKQHYCLYL